MDPEALLRHAGFVRAIARGLLSADEAEDVVQETMLAAWQRPPRDPSRVRAWLGAVGRRLSLKTLRSKRRRDSRERGTARSEVLPSAAEVTGQLEIQCKVVEAVVALDEPYRSTIVHRFFHDRSVEEIAQALGIPRKTVESRLTRALAMLRARLDDEHGRRAWTIALLPLAWPRSGVAATLGGLVMTAKAKAMVAAMFLVVAALGVWGAWHWTRPEPTERALRTGGAPSVAPLPEQADQPALAAAATASAEQPAALAVASAVPAGTILGHILCPDGKPAKGARVKVGGWLQHEDGTIPVGGSPYEVSHAIDVDDEGFYRFEGLAPGCYQLRAECDGYAPQNSSHNYIIDLKGGANWSTRLRTGGTLVVVLRDVAGAPLAGVEIETAKDARAMTDAGGQAVFGHLAVGAYPVIVRGGYGEVRTATVEEGTATTVTIVIGAVLRGVVTAEDGTPLRNARMQASLESAGGATCFAEGGTDESGQYEFQGLGPGAWKIRMGHIGVSSEARTVRIGDEPVTNVDLRLMRPSIAGRLVSSGTGFSPASVWLFHGGGRSGSAGSIGVTEDGTFTFYDLAPGKYVVSVQPNKQGYVPCEIPVTVEAGQRLEGLEITIEEVRYGDVELEISDGEGALTEAVQMFAGDPEGRKIRRSTSMAPPPASPGRFKLTLECGKRLITVRGKRGDIRVDVDVEEGRTVYKTVRLP